MGHAADIPSPETLIEMLILGFRMVLREGQGK